MAENIIIEKILKRTSAVSRPAGRARPGRSDRWARDPPAVDRKSVV